MAESSIFWDTVGAVGDGADTYSAAQVRALVRAALLSDKAAAEGVIAGAYNGLAVAGSASPLTVDTGIAVVQGIYYTNTASANVAVSTPTGGTTGHQVVLQADWAAQTVRIALISSPDGVSGVPALTQNEFTRWEIPLAQVAITTAGVVTLIDARDYCHYASGLVYRRQGGSSDWSIAGTTTFKPGGVYPQCGVVTLTWNNSDASDSLAITFPQAYSQRPIVQLGLLNAASATKRTFLASVESISNTQCVISARRTDGSAALSTTADVAWKALGPR